MKTAALVTASALIAVSAWTSDASAKDKNFSLTIGGPEGYITIGGADGKTGPKYGADSYGGNPYVSPGYGYGDGQQLHQPGYGYGYGKPQDLRGARDYGYCMRPRQIRRKLWHEGWRGFDVVRLRPQIAVVRAYRHGSPYRLKIDRCSGTVLKAKRIGGYAFGGYW